MYDNSFSPQILRLPEPAAVRFVNKGRNIHNAIADDGSWSTAESFGTLVMETGDETELRFDTPGIHPYFCTYHGSPGKGMWGTVVVGDIDFDPQSAGVREPVSEASGVVRHVPGEYPTIQSGVDAASPGDLVLIEPGVYREEVLVTTPSLVLRGTDRNEVVIDAEHLRGNGVIVLADGVAIENMTARNAVTNGFYWTSVKGYRASYLTAYNNGDYGVYAFDSVDGLIEHSYGSGHPDSAFYIGQCNPCRAVVRNVVAEYNATGYSGTNASGELFVVSSVWRNNMTGILPNTLDSEAFPPQGDAAFIANFVVANGNHEAAAKPLMYPGFGNGILVFGGVRNRVERNLVLDHPGYGILVSAMFHENFWPTRGNIIRDNVVLRSGLADIAEGAPGSRDNCFEGNRFDTASPAGLEGMQGCGGLRVAMGVDVVPSLAMLRRKSMADSGNYLHGDHRTRPTPPPQAQLPEGAAAPVRPAMDVYDGLEFDLAAVELPAEALALLATLEDAESSPRSWFSPFERFGAHIWWLVYVWWVVWALRTLRREEPSARLFGWLALIALVPYLGALARLVVTAPPQRKLRRALLLFAVLAAWDVLLVAGMMASPA